MQQLRVGIGGVQALAARWCASAGELNATVAPGELSLSCQASAAAVNAANADIAAFTASLAQRVGARASNVGEAAAHYVANETSSAKALVAVARLVMSV